MAEAVADDAESAANSKAVVAALICVDACSAKDHMGSSTKAYSSSCRRCKVVCTCFVDGLG